MIINVMKNDVILNNPVYKTVCVYIFVYINRKIIAKLHYFIASLGAGRLWFQQGK